VINAIDDLIEIRLDRMPKWLFSSKAQRFIVPSHFLTWMDLANHPLGRDMTHSTDFAKKPNADRIVTPKMELPISKSVSGVSKLNASALAVFESLC
jgi:hypothetical protein